MPSYTLEIQAKSSHLVDTPSLEIWAEGSLQSTNVISSSTTTISTSVSYSGTYPAGLSFLFDDLLSETGRLIDIQSVKINGYFVNINNFSSSNSLLFGQSSVMSLSDAGFMFSTPLADPADFTSPTVTLTAGDDLYTYTGSDDQIVESLAGRDTLRLGSGNDNINGGNGIDIMYGGAGNDLMNGQEGNDRLYGQDGDDTMYGGDGVDRLQGDNGNDTLYGNDGKDTLVGRNGDDLLVGGEGNDKLTGGNDNDILYGEAGEDQLIGGSGNDSLDGGSGDDIAYGGTGDDIVNGNTGNDILAANAGNDFVYGDEGDDEIYGGSGMNVLSGGTGDDIIYSQSSATLDTTIADILTNNAGVVYNEDTNSFYQYVPAIASWATADTVSNAATLTGLAGVNGHLVTITSATENAYIDSLIGIDTVWLGASDAVTEGEWIWNTGPEDGTPFWSGTSAGSDVNSWYNDWIAGQPSNLASLNDYAQFTGGIGWSAAKGTITPNSYIIEWEADSLLSTIDSNTINGGDDVDELYGDDGIDIFVFDNTNDIDTIFDFEADNRDQIDLTALIDYDIANDDINDFIQLTESGGDTTIGVDVNGTTGGASFTDIATLDSVTGLDLAVLLAGDNIIV